MLIWKLSLPKCNSAYTVCHYIPSLPFEVRCESGIYIHYVPLSHLRSKGTASAYITYCTGSGMLTRYVPLSHLRSKGKSSAYILYCTGSGMLTRNTHCCQCNIFYIALTTAHMSRYSILKSPKNYQIPLMQRTLSCMFVYIKY